MGRFIELDKLSSDDEEWLVPRHFRRYDQRYKPWPNELWPYGLTCNAFWIQDSKIKIGMRRFIDRHCDGDVVLEHNYIGYTSQWQFWFEFESDCAAFANEYQQYLTEETNK